MNPKRGLLIGRLGVPGSWKSSFVRSATKVGKLAVAVTQPDELDGYPTGDSNLESELFYDAEWLPTLGSYSAEGYSKLVKWLAAFRERPDVAVVAIDNFGGASELIMHDTLKMEQVAYPGQMSGDARVPYIGVRSKTQELMNILKVLTLVGKHIIVTFHVAMKEYEGATSATQVTQKVGAGVQMRDWRFEDQLLPVMHGGMRQEMGGHFSLWLYSEPLGNGRFRLLSISSGPSPAKSRIQLDPKLAPNGRIENDFAALLKAISNNTESVK